MNHCRILSACFICFFIAACDTQEQNTAIEETTESKIAAEKISPQKPTRQKITSHKVTIEETRPALNLSIDNIAIENQNKNDNSFIEDKEPIEKNSALFEILNKGQTETNINLSGKLLTDEDKLENEEYLDSVDGVQINIEGNFE